MPTDLNWIARASSAAWYWLDVAGDGQTEAKLPNRDLLADAEQLWQPGATIAVFAFGTFSVILVTVPFSQLHCIRSQRGKR